MGPRDAGLLDLASGLVLPVLALQPASLADGAVPGAFSGLAARARLVQVQQGLNIKTPIRPWGEPGFLWALLDLNQRPTDYESAALTN